MCRLMHWKETGGVEKLFALPGRLLHSQPLFKHYQRNLTAKPAEDENVSVCATKRTLTFFLKALTLLEILSPPQKGRYIFFKAFR